jgi:4-amino-4-deoxy-L-arabinose transferase-like glycosyltransferase
LLLIVMVTRIAAHFALPQTLTGEELTSFTAARELANGQWPSWSLGAQALHTLGYPLLLAPVMALAGATTEVAFSVNLALAMISALLVWQVARQLGLRDTGQKLSLLGYALWLPGIWNCTLVTRENLGTALLLLSAWLALRLLREGPRMTLALAAGAAWAAGLLTEPSLLPAISAPVLALVLAGQGWRLPASALALAAGAALMLGPWSWISGAMVETPAPCWPRWPPAPMRRWPTHRMPCSGCSHGMLPWAISRNSGCRICPMPGMPHRAPSP